MRRGCPGAWRLRRARARTKRFQLREPLDFFIFAACGLLLKINILERKSFERHAAALPLERRASFQSPQSPGGKRTLTLTANRKRAAACIAASWPDPSRSAKMMTRCTSAGIATLLIRLAPRHAQTRTP